MVRGLHIALLALAGCGETPPGYCVADYGAFGSFDCQRISELLTTSLAVAADAGARKPDVRGWYFREMPLTPTEAERDAGYGVIWARTVCRDESGRELHEVHLATDNWRPQDFCHEVAVHISAGCVAWDHELAAQRHTDGKCAAAFATEGSP